MLGSKVFDGFKDHVTVQRVVTTDGSGSNDTSPSKPRLPASLGSSLCQVVVFMKAKMYKQRYDLETGRDLEFRKFCF